ncbi:ROK family protein [Lactococcus piscium]|uniref:ROK family protein n=1 Tax=Pseudolactococcus piscium TaxID=1364 RepID=A0A2A5S2U8_9LACT|nr:ROK family protein [Lactococcus piscium]PCS07805.1 ROK family protein [Lactococcus piscium]
MDYFSIDIGGTFIKYGVVDHSGVLLSSNKIKTPATLSEFIEGVFQLIMPVKDRIKGIGVSVPGKVDTRTGVIYFGGALNYLHKCPLKKIIEEKFNIRCELSNDGKAAALAELWLGNLKGVKHGAAIVLGTGVGGGLIINGELFQGSDYQAGELSFMIPSSKFVNENDMLGMSHSAINFIKKATEMLGISDATDGMSVFKYIKNKQNTKVNKLFDSYCEKIAILIINLQAVLDISTVVIGGGISQDPILIDNIIIHYKNIRKKSKIIELSLKLMTIKSCRFLSDANLLGAVYQLLSVIDQEN